MGPVKGHSFVNMSSLIKHGIFRVMFLLSLPHGEVAHHGVPREAAHNLHRVDAVRRGLTSTDHITRLAVNGFRDAAAITVAHLDELILGRQFLFGPEKCSTSTN